MLKNAPITLAINRHTHRHVIHPPGAIGSPYPVAAGGGSKDGGAIVMMLEVTTEKLSLKLVDVDGRTVEKLEIPAPAH